MDFIKLTKILPYSKQTATLYVKVLKLNAFYASGTTTIVELDALTHEVIESVDDILAKIKEVDSDA